MLSVELGHLARVLDIVGQGRDISRNAKIWSKRTREAVLSKTVSDQSVLHLLRC